VVYDSAPYGKFKLPKAQIWNFECLMKFQKNEQFTILGFILTSSDIPQNMGPNENQMEVISYLSPFGRENKLRERERILRGANNGPLEI